MKLNITLPPEAENFFLNETAKGYTLEEHLTDVVQGLLVSLYDSETEPLENEPPDSSRRPLEPRPTNDLVTIETHNKQKETHTMKINIELQLETNMALRLLRHAQQCTPKPETVEHLASMILTRHILKHFNLPEADKHTLMTLYIAEYKAEKACGTADGYNIHDLAKILRAYDTGRVPDDMQSPSEAATSIHGDTGKLDMEEFYEWFDDRQKSFITEMELYPEGETPVLDPSPALTDAERREMDRRCEQYDREHEAYMHDLATRPVEDEEEGGATDNTHVADMPRPAEADATAITGDDHTEQEGQA